MKRVTSVLLISLILSGSSVNAETPPVEITAPESEAWIGERIRIFIELNAKGSFSGSASFDLPEIPGSLLIKVGSPVVSSREIDGESWFTQKHDFALFSQREGELKIPPFPVRFEAREGFTGPANPVVAETTALSLQVQRPPGSEGIPFLVTTKKLEISETWEPDPGGIKEASVGDVLRRTIVQRASGLTGMALAPAIDSEPEGVRVYEPQVETSDKTERGAFEGERRETVTYLLQEPGTRTLPELKYTWWNPETETLESKTLPEVEIYVARSETADVLENQRSGRRWIIWFAAVLSAGVLFWLRSPLIILLCRIWRFFFPLEQKAARSVLRACRKGDAGAAQVAWERWLATVDSCFRPSTGLKSAVLEMQRFSFGPSKEGAWSGTTLAKAFSSMRRDRKKNRNGSTHLSLPMLNGN